MLINYEYENHVYNVEVEHRQGIYYVTYGEDTYTAEANEVRPGHLVIKVGDRIIKCIITQINNERFVFIDGDVFRVKEVALTGTRKGSSDEGALNSPISGRVVKVKVAVGDNVKKGEVIMVIESMKMEYLIKAPYDGVVDKVYFKDGDQVEIGQKTVELRKTKGE